MDLTFLKTYAGKRVCVAVSGGVDSVCLLHAFTRVREEYGIALTALTCDHMIRGENSLADVKFVEELCKRWQVPLTCYSANVPARARESGRGLEEEGRLFRYECFSEILSEGRAELIATAHHRDDFAETVLFRLARGTSAAGLAAIYEREGIVRPFLHLTRAEIETYARENGIAYVTDESNGDERFTRNAIRGKVLPALNACVSGASAHLVEFALRTAEDEAFLESLAEKELVREGETIFVPLTLPAPLFTRACLIAMKELGCERDYAAANLKELLRLKELQSGRRVCLPHAITGVREGERVALYLPKQSAIEELPFGDGEFSFNGYTVSVGAARREGLYADAEKFPAGCVLRCRREGDKFTPFAGKEKALKEYLTDKKIPARVGRELPLVAKGEEVFAVLGVEISDKVKVTEGTKKTVYLTIAKN